MSANFNFNLSILAAVASATITEKNGATIINIGNKNDIYHVDSGPSSNMLKAVTHAMAGTYNRYGNFFFKGGEIKTFDQYRADFLNKKSAYVSGSQELRSMVLMGQVVNPSGGTIVDAAVYRMKNSVGLISVESCFVNMEGKTYETLTDHERHNTRATTLIRNLVLLQAILEAGKGLSVCFFENQSFLVERAKRLIVGGKQEAIEQLQEGSDRANITKATNAMQAALTNIDKYEHAGEGKSAMTFIGTDGKVHNVAELVGKSVRRLSRTGRYQDQDATDIYDLNIAKLFVVGQNRTGNFVEIVGDVNMEAKNILLSA